MLKPGAAADWMKSVAWLSSAGHVLAGCNVILATALFSHCWAAMWVAELALAAYVLPKEFWYDLKYESGETVASSTVDAIGYGAGSLVAWTMLLIARHLGTW